MEETAARLYRRELQCRGGKREMDHAVRNSSRDGAIACRAPISLTLYGPLRFSKRRQVVGPK